MKVLITGSAGLIGSALKQALEKLSIFCSGLDIKHELDHPDQGDILDTESLRRQTEEVDGIIHLAAVSRVITGEKNPDLCWKTNVEGTRNVIAAAEVSIKKPWIIYASSREVYGQPEILPVHESSPLKPVNIYGESKAAAEKLMEQAKVKTSIVRFSNVYGSVHDHKDRVVPAFCRAAATGGNIYVEGSDNVFDFTYIEDVINGLLSLILLLTRSEIAPPPIHFVTGRAKTLGEIATIAQNISPLPIEISQRPSRSFDVSQFYGDPARAASLLNWKSCISVEEGMTRLITDYQLFLNNQTQASVGTSQSDLSHHSTL